MATPATSALKRFGRAVIALAAASLVAYFKDNLAYLGLGPIILTLGKYLRAKWSLKNIPF